MGTASRTSSASRSRSPRDLAGTQGQNIPEMFRAGRSNMAPSRHSQGPSSQPSSPPHHMPTPPPQLLPPANGEDGIELRPHPPLTILDLRSMADDIKNALAAAISELRLDLKSLNDRVQVVENVSDHHEVILQSVTEDIDSHTRQLRDMQRHVEDLDNRGRRHNLRIRGLPETFEGDQISTAIVSIFNSLLDRPAHTPIVMDRIHRALRPKGRDTDPPRDIICYIVDFRLKEEILKMARGRSQILHEGSPVQIYQDLSGITLQHRRDLRPLLETLRDRQILYKWKFPFCLSASTHGHTAILKVPEDLPHFCATLGIPLIPVPNWYAAFRPRTGTPREDPMETQAPQLNRRRSPSTHRSITAHRSYHRTNSPDASPRPRGTCRSRNRHV